MKSSDLSAPRHGIACAFLLVLSVAQPGFAQTASEKPADPEQETLVLNPFSVNATQTHGYQAASSLSGTRLNTKLIDTPLSITVLTRELLTDIGFAQELSKAVSYTANVAINNRTSDNFRLRGFSSTNYRDGIAVASNVAMDEVMVQNVEVVRGPTSVLYGVSQPGGLINVISKVPLDYQSAQIGLAVGSYGFSRATVDVTGPLTADKKWLYRVVGSYLDTDSWRDFEWQKRVFVSPSLTWRPNNQLEVTGSVYRQKGSGMYNSLQMWWNDVDREFLNLPRSWSRNDATDSNQTLMDSAKLDLAYRINDAWAFRAVGLWNDSRFQMFDTFTGTVRKVNGRLVTDRTQRDLTINNVTLNFQANLVGKFSTGPFSHVLLLGVEDREGREFRGDRRIPWQGLFDILAPNNYGTLASNVILDSLQPTDNNGQAAFVQETFGMLDDRLFLIGGLRYEDFSTSSTTVNVLNNTVTGPQALEDTEPTTRLGALWKITPQISAFVTYNQGFNGSLGVDIFSGRLLKSEISEGREGGFKFNFLNDRLSGSAVYYEVSRNNITLTDGGTGARVQLGQVTSTGVELEMFYSLTQNWQLIAGIATCDSVVTDDINPTQIGLKSENTPEVNAVLWTKYGWTSGALKGLFVGFGGRYEGKKTDRANVAYQKPSEVFNGVVGWENSRFRFQLNLDNIFDEDYFEEIQITRGAKRGAPFEARLTSTIKF